jgi:putative transposase
MNTFTFTPGLIIRYYLNQYELISFENKTLNFEEIYSRDKLMFSEIQFFSELKRKNLSITRGKSSPNQIVTDDSNEEELFINLEDIPEKYQLDAKRKLYYINELQKRGVSRGDLKSIEYYRHRISKEAADHFGTPGTSTIHSWWKTWEESGKNIASLVSGYALKKYNPLIDQVSEEFIYTQIKLHYAVLTRPSVKSAFSKYQTALLLENTNRKIAGRPPLQEIVLRTFHKKIKKLPEYDLLVAREGSRSANMKKRQIKGHLPSEYPLDVIEIDHAQMNLFVIDDIALLPLGIPWITLAKDRYSGVVVGFSISFKKTGLESIFDCLRNSLEPHTAAYKLWPDLHNPWPCYGLAHCYCSDRGRDYLSPKYVNAISNLGGSVEYCAAYSPAQKGGIESLHNQFEQSFFDTLPGKTFSSIAKRGDYDPKKHAVIRFSILIYLVHKWIVDIYNVSTHHNTRSRRIDLWNDGVAKVPPPIIQSFDKLDIILGIEHEGSLSHEGIRFKHLKYASKDLHELRKTLPDKSKIKFYVSNKDLGSIQVFNPLIKKYLEVPCTRLDYANGLTLFQHEYILDESNLTDSKDYIDSCIVTRGVIAHKVGNELSQNKIKNLTQLARLSNITSQNVLNEKPNSITKPFDRPAPQLTLVQKEEVYIPKIHKWGR